MYHFNFTKYSHILDIVLILFFYFLAYLSLTYLKVVFPFFSAFLIFSFTIHIFRKDKKSAFMILIILFINSFTAYLYLKLSDKTSIIMNGFISGVFFMLGNIQIVMSIIQMKYKFLKEKRCMKHNETIKNNHESLQAIQPKNSDIIWEDWKDK